VSYALICVMICLSNRPRHGLLPHGIAFGFDESLDQASLIALSSMLDLMQQELDFSRGEALTLASLTVDLIRRPAFTYPSSSVPGKPRYRKVEWLMEITSNPFTV
jgi:hypothetical protein